MHEGARLPRVWSQLQGQIYLGSAAFITKMQALMDKKPSLTEKPRAQRRALKRALSDFADEHPRDQAIALAYLSGRHTMVQIARHFDVHNNGEPIGESPRNESIVWNVTLKDPIAA